MANKKKTPEINRDQIINWYMVYFVRQKEDVLNVPDFCHFNKLEEADFHEFFDSISQLEKVIWEQLMTLSIQTIKDDDMYASFEPRDKILSLYYTFFENLTLNRDYVIKNLQLRNSITQKFKVYNLLKPIYHSHIDEVFEIKSKPFKPTLKNPLENLRKKSLREGFWLLLLFIIDFWRKDTSESFEKTDLAIEKSVTVAMDLVDTSRIMNVVDLGKFLWQERNAFSFKKAK